MSSQEKDFLTYTGNKIPRVIRMVWTLLLVFCGVYVVLYLLPDLSQWIKRVQ